MTQPAWPVAEFDMVRRLHVIAGAAPGAQIYERILDAPLATVWAVAADLEGELAQWLFPDIRSVRLTPGYADRSVATVVGYSGLRARFDLVRQPAWCLLQGRHLLGGMAATTEEGRTRFALLIALRGPLRPLAPLTGRLTRPTAQHALDRFAVRVRQRRTTE